MNLDHFNFKCPHCNHSVSSEDSIVLTTVRNSGEKGKIQLSSLIGNYAFNHFPIVTFTPGELIGFYCPFCEKSLVSQKYPTYALLIMEVRSGIQFEVIFSCIAGVRETKVITEDGIETYTG